MRVGAVMQCTESKAMRIVNDTNLEVSMFLVARRLWKVVSQDASGVTDEQMKYFPQCDHDEILKQRGLFYVDGAE